MRMAEFLPQKVYPLVVPLSAESSYKNLLHGASTTNLEITVKKF